MYGLVALAAVLYLGVIFVVIGLAVAARRGDEQLEGLVADRAGRHRRAA